MGKVILYIATSADGFIADKNGGVDWLPQPPEEDTTDKVGYKALLKNVDIIIMGSKSYAQILGFGDWAWPDKTTYVFTHRTFPKADSIIFVNEKPSDLIAHLTAKFPEQNVWLLGGAQLITSFAQEKLIDECIITIAPVAIGTGIPLNLPYDDFTLAGTKTCCGIYTQNTYIKKA